MSLNANQLLTENSSESHNNLLFLEIPLENEFANIKVALVRNKLIIERKKDMDMLRNIVFRWYNKYGTLDDQEYSEYVNARTSHPNESFGIHNNPYHMSTTLLASNLLERKKTQGSEIKPMDTPFDEHENFGDNFENFTPIEPQQVNSEKVQPGDENLEDSNTVLQHQTSIGKKSKAEKIIMKTEGDQEWVKLYYPTGLKKFEGILVHGKKHGEGREFYPNGGIKYIGNYSDDKPNSPNGTYYHDNGNVMYNGFVVDGILSGEGSLYHYNAALGFQGTFKNNGPHGKTIKMFDRFSHLVYEGSFNEGKREGSGQEYFINGQLKYEGEFKADKIHGKNIKVFNIDGQLDFEGDMNEGEKNRGKYFFTNGQMYYDGMYKNNMPHGENVTTYHKNGAVHYQGTLLEGKYAIKGKLFYDNGQLLYDGTFKNGKIWNKNAKIYDQKGTLKYHGAFNI